MSLHELADVCGTDKGSHQGFAKLYDRYLPGPDAPITLVELGVYLGNSLKMWTDYFRHNDSQIIGVDLDITDEAHNQPYVRAPFLIEGDQADPAVAVVVSALLGEVDVLIDDASHEGDKTEESFDTWWPQVKAGGLYVIEDTHCSYNTDIYKTAGKPGTTGTLMEFVKTLADDVNWGIHGYDRFDAAYRDIAYVHFYPGIVFIGKKEQW